MGGGALRCHVSFWPVRGCHGASPCSRRRPQPGSKRAAGLSARSCFIDSCWRLAAPTSSSYGTTNILLWLSHWVITKVFRMWSRNSSGPAADNGGPTVAARGSTGRTMPARSTASAVVARGPLRRCACGCRRRTEQHNLHGLRPIPRRATPRAAPPRLAGLLEKQPPTALVGGTIQTRLPCKPNLVMAASIHTPRMVWNENPSLEYLPVQQVGGRDGWRVRRARAAGCPVPRLSAGHGPPSKPRRAGSLLGTQQDHGRVADELSRRRAQFNVDKTDRGIMDVDQPGR